jgi:hypothetical protein
VEAANKKGAEFVTVPPLAQPTASLISVYFAPNLASICYNRLLRTSLDYHSRFCETRSEDDAGCTGRTLQVIILLIILGESKHPTRVRRSK